ncbi:MAG: hypothetical protein WCD11_20180 [Solirubrobacteraceae bacterium]
MAVWSIDWLVRTEGGEREVPAFSFLLVQPTAVRIQLLAIVDAVRTTGPDRWKDTTSHDSMRGVCAQLHEARDRHGQMLYRLYLRWQREHHRVVIVDGGAKPNSTTLPDSFYEDLAALAATAELDSAPFATADDFARIALHLLGDQ